MSPHTPAARRWRAIAVFALVLLATAALVSILIWRAHRTDLTAKRLCQVISQIVSDGDQRLNGVAYYQHHPAELARAHADNRRILRQLDCRAHPPVRSKP